MKGKYEIQDVEMSRYEQKKISIVWEGEEWEQALCRLSMIIYGISNRAVHLQLIEREDTGVLFVRAIVMIDARPFCEHGEQIGPDKFGFI